MVLLMVGTTLMFGGLPALQALDAPGALLRAASSLTIGSASGRGMQQTLSAAT